MVSIRDNEGSVTAKATIAPLHAACGREPLQVAELMPMGPESSGR